MLCTIYSQDPGTFLWHIYLPVILPWCNKRWARTLQSLLSSSWEVNGSCTTGFQPNTPTCLRFAEIFIGIILGKVYGNATLTSGNLERVSGFLRVKLLILFMVLFTFCSIATVDPSLQRMLRICDDISQQLPVMAQHALSRAGHKRLPPTSFSSFCSSVCSSGSWTSQLFKIILDVFSLPGSCFLFEVSFSVSFCSALKVSRASWSSCLHNWAISSTRNMWWPRCSPDGSQSQHRPSHAPCRRAGVSLRDAHRHVSSAPLVGSTWLP